MYNSRLIRIAAFILAVVLIYGSVAPVQVQAITGEDVYDTFALPVDFVTLCWYYMTRSDFFTWFDHSESDPGSLMFYFIYSPLNCPENPDRRVNDGYAPHEWKPSPSIDWFEGDDPCLYCGMTFKEFREAVADERSLWEDDLPSGLDASSEGVTAAGSGVQLLSYDTDAVKAFWRGVDLVGLGSAATPGDVMLISSESSPLNGSSKIWGFVKQHSTVFDVDVLNLYQSFSIAPYTVKDFPVGEFVWFAESVSQEWTGTVFGKALSSGTTYLPVTACLSYDDAFKVYRSGLYTGTKIYFLTSDSYIVPKQLSDGLMTSDNCFTVSELGHIDESGNVAYENNMVFRGSYSSSYCDYASYYFFPLDVDVSGDFTEDSRPSGIMDAIQQYNITHNYGDSNVVNYYIGSFDEDDNLTGYYPMDIYDEQTLVFTEPVTGAQYQTTGWRYDYAARRYTLDMEPGTFSLGDYDILQIKLTYGDDAVTIQYFNELGELVETDEYQYIMVAKEACTLNGHSYSVEVTKDATCTTSGQQVSTCAVCGNQEIRYVPAALGHDWLRVADQPASYDLPAGVSCPACNSLSFYAEMDAVSPLYTCFCSDCDQMWTVDAVLTPGYTLYECSRCGKQQKETDAQKDGLFTSAGNLIADGIVWCTEKLTQLVNSITSMVDTFSAYLDSLANTGGAFPLFVGAVFTALPDELINLFWLSLVGLVLLSVWLKWFR